MASSKMALSNMVLRIALACFLIATGILTLQLDSGFWGKLQAGINGNEIANAVHHFFKGDLANMLIMLLGALCVIAGAFLIVGFFVNTGSINKIVLLVLLVLWCVIIFLVDIMGTGGLFDGAFKNMPNFLTFLKVLSAHLLVLGAIFNVMEE